MSPPANFYLEQVAICARAARDCRLDNEREKYLRSQAAWQALADRTIEVATARALREAKV